MTQLRVAYRLAQTGLEDVHHLCHLRFRRNLRRMVHHGRDEEAHAGGDRRRLLARKRKEEVYRVGQAQEQGGARQLISVVVNVTMYTLTPYTAQGRDSQRFHGT